MYEDVSNRLIETLKAPYSPDCKPVLPDELLYDDVGLPIWNDIIFTPEFYQTHDEIALFDNHGADLAKRVHEGTTVIDLGAGLVHLSTVIVLPRLHKPPCPIYPSITTTRPVLAAISRELTSNWID